MIRHERKVQNATIKMFGGTWKHPALKPYNGKTVSVCPRLNEYNRTELTVLDGAEVICVIWRGQP